MFIPNRIFSGLLVAVSVVVFAGCAQPSSEIPESDETKVADNASVYPMGTFQDDYNIRYEISDTSWVQIPGGSYHIASTDTGALILHQPASDSTAERWTRVDWTRFEDMDPWTWGFCYTAWDLPTKEAALASEPADASTPMTGCGGFPFSRMQSTP